MVTRLRFIFRFQDLASSRGLACKEILRWPRHCRENKLISIYNWCDEVTIHPATPDNELVSRLGLSDCFKLMSAGIMGTAQALILIGMQ
jgi:hypothetical protein